MILIVTHSRDLSADLVIRHLYRSREKYLRVNTDKLGTSQCFFGFSSEPELMIAGRAIRASDVSAVWARRFALPESLESIAPEHTAFVRRELSTVMDSFLESIPNAFQINPSHADRLAGNRLLQAQTAKLVGFSVPVSLVTQDLAAVRDFVVKYPQVITKAISFGQISNNIKGERVAFSSLVSKDADFSGLMHCPSLFQELIPKRFDWRIMTVGHQIFSARTEPRLLPLQRLRRRFVKNC